MLITRAMTARRTEQFLKELQFQLDEIQRIMISAYAKNGQLVTYTPVIAIRTDYMKAAKLPSQAKYIVEIYTDDGEFDSTF